MSAPPFAELADQLVNLDVRGRGVDHLHRAARAHFGVPLAWRAAELLAAIPRGSTVVVTTGMAVRTQVSPAIAENDGPAGTAGLARVLAEALDVIPVLVAEAALLPALTGVFQAAGLSPVSIEQARRRETAGGRLAVVVAVDYPAEDSAGRAAAGPLLDAFGPALLFSAERAGRNALGVYHGARGNDSGSSTARIDLLFEAAAARGLQTICAGDGGNEIGMGVVAEAVAERVQFGAQCRCGCGGGIAAATGATVLVTAAISNWACHAISDCLAVQLGRLDLLHTAELEQALLRRGVELGLINSPLGLVDTGVDGIPLAGQLAVVQLLGELARQT